MVIFKHPATNIWILIYILFPLSPFLLGGVIRLVLSRDPTWTTFNASDLAISFALLCLFINQSLLKNEILLPNDDKVEDVELKAYYFLTFSGIFFFLFISNVFCDSIIKYYYMEELETSFHIFQIFVFILSVPAFIMSIKVQQTFKLRAYI